MLFSSKHTWPYTASAGVAHILRGFQYFPLAVSLRGEITWTEIAWLREQDVDWTKTVIEEGTCAIYLLTPTSWYQQTFQSLGNKLLLILWHSRLPKIQYDLLKTPLILALSTYNSKKNSVTPIFYYRIVMSMVKCNFLQFDENKWGSPSSFSSCKGSS